MKADKIILLALLFIVPSGCYGCPEQRLSKNISRDGSPLSLNKENGYPMPNLYYKTTSNNSAVTPILVDDNTPPPIDYNDITISKLFWRN